MYNIIVLRQYDREKADRPATFLYNTITRSIIPNVKQSLKYICLQLTLYDCVFMSDII